jgi:glycosyltransferase involved in cell wall biosynthesis
MAGSAPWPQRSPTATFTMAAIFIRVPSVSGSAIPAKTESSTMKSTISPTRGFLLVGTGPERDMLENLDRSLGNSNVFFIGSVEKEQMPEIVAASSATVVTLKKLDLFLGAIPSKIFENLAMRKPVFLGVDGEARTLFIDEGKAGWYFEPENDADLALKIKEEISKLFPLE